MTDIQPQAGEIVKQYVHLTGREAMAKSHPHYKHGHASGGTTSKEYNSWASAKQRCHDTKIECYYRYGGRGIKMCDRWRLSFVNFLEDMGKCPPGFELERKDNNGNYEPSNCKWVTHVEQCRNRRSNRKITANGKTQLMIDWERETGLSSSLILARIVKLKWSPSKAVLTPARRFRRTKINRYNSKSV